LLLIVSGSPIKIKGSNSSVGVGVSVGVRVGVEVGISATACVKVGVSVLISLTGGITKIEVGIVVGFSSSTEYGPTPKINMMSQTNPHRIAITNTGAKNPDFFGGCGRRGVAIEGNVRGVLFLA
jgi:hypothetical protein